MSFPNKQPTDTVWLVSSAAYAHLCQRAVIDARSRPAVARRLVTRFLQLAKRVDNRLSRLEFDISGQPLSIPVTFGMELREDEVSAVCHVGMFERTALLEMALSCRGFKAVPSPFEESV